MKIETSHAKAVCGILSIDPDKVRSIDYVEVDQPDPESSHDDGGTLTVTAVDFWRKAQTTIQLTQFHGGDMQIAFVFNRTKNVVLFHGGRFEMLSYARQAGNEWGQPTVTARAGDADGELVASLFQEMAVEALGAVQKVIFPKLRQRHAPRPQI